MEKTAKWSFEIGGFPIVFDLPVVITSTVTCLIVLLLSLLAARKLTMIPAGIQNAVEMIIDFTKGIVRSNMDLKTSERFYSLAFALFMFLFIANELGLIFNIVDDHHYAWWKSPTADINVAFAMAFAITLMAHFLGVKKSPKQYLKHYTQPYWWMLPMHLIDEISKPVTHGIRLWANIFAGEVLIIIMVKYSPLFTGAPLLAWIGYSLFVGIVQAYVFTTLAFVYISQKISTDH
jgi:F-type H+-transporting ATPase subunit a